MEKKDYIKAKLEVIKINENIIMTSSDTTVATTYHDSVTPAPESATRR